MSIKVRGFFAMLTAALWFSGNAGAQEAPEPTPYHKGLAEEVGVWDAEMFYFKPGSDEATPAGKGVETNTMLSGGLWLLSDFKGDPGPGAFEGRGQTGYDPKKQKYIGTWVDSMSPRMMILEGTYDEKTKTATMFGEGDDTGGQASSIKTTTHQPDAENRVFTLFIKPKDAKEYVKTIEIRYKKRPAAK